MPFNSSYREMDDDKENFEVGEDTLSSVDESSMIGSSVSKFAESTEDDEEEDDEEEMEPKLKYERLSSDLKVILRKVSDFLKQSPQSQFTYFSNLC